MTTYTLKCSKCKSTSEYTEKPGHDLYESSDLEGWSFTPAVGNICPKCNFKTVGQRIAKPIVTQAALI